MRISDWSSDVCSSDLDRVVAGLHDVAHHDLVDRAARGIGKDVGIALEQAAAAGQPRAHVEVQAAAGGAVVVAPAQALEDAVARELAGIEAGEAAVGAEGGGAGIAGAGAALVAVAVADHAATVAQGEAVRQQDRKST